MRGLTRHFRAAFARKCSVCPRIAPKEQSGRHRSVAPPVDCQDFGPTRSPLRFFHMFQAKLSPTTFLISEISERTVDSSIFPRFLPQPPKVSIDSVDNFFRRSPTRTYGSKPKSLLRPSATVAHGNT